jgi:UDP-GlcNAc:undecaprenyl-phosphate GlcNAc-1-phosphate transferase
VVLPLAGGFRVTFPHDLAQTFGVPLGNFSCEALCWLISGLWIILISNAFNLLDNMDGLCGGLALETALFLACIAYGSGQFLICGLLLSAGGSALGFLIHNFPKAKVYLGDGGALFFGYIIGTLAIGTHFFTGKGTLFAVTAPLCALAVPLYDSLSVLYIRWKAGRPLFMGDRNHLSHRLVRLGLSPRESVIAIWLLSAVTGGMAFLLTSLEGQGVILIFALTMAVLALVWILETAARRKPE